ncbi:MAG: GNAT family N-acetyltransferase [Anaerolineae bacterium]|nr:GNAT family N-acetyltransferase [Anaerolineae bacterium]
MAEITLKPITRENWRACTLLKVADDQRSFVAPNMFSLLQVLYQDPTDTFAPFGIYADETMVGFIMYGMGEFGGMHGWEIWRLMIDQRYQKQGYGRLALQQMITLMREKLQPDAIYIMFEVGNDVAQALYAGLGFTDTGIIDDGEHVYKLDLSEPF